VQAEEVAMPIGQQCPRVSWGKRKRRCVGVTALRFGGQNVWHFEKSSLTARLSASSSIERRDQFQEIATMPRPHHNTTSLPRDLRAELGIRDTYGDKKRQRNGPANRKERRQAERSNKKSGKPAAVPVKKNFQRRPVEKRYDEEEEENDDNFDVDLDEESLSDDTPAVTNSKRVSAQKLPSISKSAITKKSERPFEVSEETDNESAEYEGQTEEEESDEDSGADSIPRGAHISETVKSKLAQDDAEIAALEKKLGLKKGKKLPKAFAEDGLEDLMGDLGEASEDDSKKRKREADEWLQSKRQKALQRQAQVSEEEDEDEEDFESDDGMDNLDEEIFGSESEDEDAEDSEFDGFDKEEEAAPKKRENPYVAPVAKTETAAPQKYIPPSLRARGDPESEALTRLRRQAQGHLNKLSEANLVSILAEFEKLYREHPRQNVTSMLISLLMGLIAERSALNDTFIVLHAGFIAAVYKIMGMDFGAEIVQKIVEAMDAGGDERGKFEGKEYINLVSLLCQLYNFHVIGHPLMFDYIRLFLQEITETNTELLLKIIRSM
jgi:nucleolar MIF4G domain-containing protein 1